MFLSNKDILEAGRETATDSGTLKSLAISAATAGFTTGLTQYLDSNYLDNIIAKGNSSSNINASLSDQLKSALAESAISTVTSTAVESAINGDSFKEALKNQLVNTAVGALSNIGSKQIGQQFHNNGFSDNDFLNKAIQLSLHAGLGATASSLTGNDALSGAVSGVVAELTGEYMKSHGYSKTDGTDIAGLTAGLSALVTGTLTGLDNNEIAGNVYNGQRLGEIVAENNAYLAKRPLKGKQWPESSNNPNSLRDKLNLELLHEQIFFEDEIGGNLGFFGDSLIREDDKNLLNTYKTKEGGYDDLIMRQAVKNVGNRGTYNKYFNNCQDYIDDIRNEYNKLINNR